MSSDCCATGGRWVCIGASQSGSSHELTGLPCQDSFAASVEADCLLLAVADGAGSASHSHIGSKIAVEVAIESLRQSLHDPEETGVKKALLDAREAVLHQAEDLGVSARELACTMIVVLARSERVSACQIGDGAVVVNIDGELAALTTPQNGEYANQTNFLTDAEVESHIVLADREGMVSRVAVMTDGLQPVALVASQQPFDPFFTAMFDFVERHREDTNVGEAELGEFLRSERLRSRTDDDVTLVVAAVFQGAVDE
jgi:serine/threonine protein phosphatase PrpC